MKKIITFEIHDITTNEVLSNNLCFDDLPELLYAYQTILPTHRIEACYRETTITEKVYYTPKADFKRDWYEFIDDIVDNFM